MSDPGAPQTPQDWTKYWQEQGQFQNKYAEPKAPDQVPYGFDSFEWRFPYAGWLSRVAAALLDGFLLLCLELVAGVVVYAATQELTSAFIGAYAVGIPVTIWFQWRNGSTGQTPGKRVMGIRVVHHQDGQPIGGPMGLVRGLVGWAISAFTCGLAGLLDVLWPLWDDKKRTLHDMVVGSVVIRNRAM